jgi:hypothetical protein
LHYVRIVSVRIVSVRIVRGFGGIVGIVGIVRIGTVHGFSPFP